MAADSFPLFPLFHLRTTATIGKGSPFKTIPLQETSSMHKVISTLATELTFQLGGAVFREEYDLHRVKHWVLWLRHGKCSLSILL